MPFYSKVKNSAQIKTKEQSTVSPSSRRLGQEGSFEHAPRIGDVQLENVPASFYIHP